jgi:transcriptional regulator NrdR family protein
MKQKKHIVKRRGHKVSYDSRKVYASCYAAALNCHYGELKSEKIAKYVTTKINEWIKNKATVDSEEIRDRIISILNGKDKDVALMYKHFLDLS